MLAVRIATVSILARSCSEPTPSLRSLMDGQKAQWVESSTREDDTSA